MKRKPTLSLEEDETSDKRRQQETSDVFELAHSNFRIFIFIKLNIRPQVFCLPQQSPLHVQQRRS